jgi:hypothetical protein
MPSFIPLLYNMPRAQKGALGYADSARDKHCANRVTEEPYFSGGFTVRPDRVTYCVDAGVILLFISPSDTCVFLDRVRIFVVDVAGS